MCSCSNYGCPDNENGTCWSCGCDEHKMSRWDAESELDCDEDDESEKEMVLNMETTNSIVEEVMLRIDETEKMHDYTMATDTVRVIIERLKSAHEREMEEVLRERNDFHAALLTICNGNTNSRGQREIAINACNNRGGAQ